MVVAPVGVAVAPVGVVVAPAGVAVAPAGVAVAMSQEGFTAYITEKQISIYFLLIKQKLTQSLARGGLMRACHIDQ